MEWIDFFFIIKKENDIFFHCKATVKIIYRGCNQRKSMDFSFWKFIKCVSKTPTPMFLNGVDRFFFILLIIKKNKEK